MAYGRRTYARAKNYYSAYKTRRKARRRKKKNDGLFGLGILGIL